MTGTTQNASRRNHSARHSAQSSPERYTTWRNQPHSLPELKYNTPSATYATLPPMWVGIAGSPLPDKTKYEIAISVHDTMYNTDFGTWYTSFAPDQAERNAKEIEDHVYHRLRAYSRTHQCKFVGAGLTLDLLREVPNLCTKLWLDLDIVPFVFHFRVPSSDSSSSEGSRSKSRLRSSTPANTLHHSAVPSPSPLSSDQESALPSSPRPGGTRGAAIPGAAVATLTAAAAALRVPVHAIRARVTERLAYQSTLDEQADAVARKCVRQFGPNNSPRLFVGMRNRVDVDAQGRIHLVDDVEEYRKTVDEKTWDAVIKLADEIRERKIKFGFFSSTPQGGGVALMRHALIRFLSLLDVDATWYVPTPSPTALRATKNIHSVLQGIAPLDLRVSDADKATLDGWIVKNAIRWMADGGPLCWRRQGLGLERGPRRGEPATGVDIVVIDDPQMQGLIPLIRRANPDVPIVFRSHIEIRSDLVDAGGTPQEDVWQYLWQHIKLADVFISHPVSKFVPSSVPWEEVAFLGGSMDWLDGLNKTLDPWDAQFYFGMLRDICARQRMPELEWPRRGYIIQFAQFDPSKGIPSVIDAYAKFRRMLLSKEVRVDGRPEHDWPRSLLVPPAPQLLICGRGAIDDPDGSAVYEQAIDLVKSEAYREFEKDIVVVWLPPCDQLLNALLHNAQAAVQVSSRKGYEIAVSAAQHAGTPVIASRVSGVALQIRHGETGLLVGCCPAERTTLSSSDEEEREAGRRMADEDVAERAEGRGAGTTTGGEEREVETTELAECLNRLHEEPGLRVRIGEAGRAKWDVGVGGEAGTVRVQPERHLRHPRACDRVNGDGDGGVCEEPDGREAEDQEMQVVEEGEVEEEGGRMSGAWRIEIENVDAGASASAGDMEGGGGGEESEPEREDRDWAHRVQREDGDSVGTVENAFAWLGLGVLFGRAGRGRSGAIAAAAAAADGGDGGGDGGSAPAAVDGGGRKLRFDGRPLSEIVWDLVETS